MTSIASNARQDAPIGVFDSGVGGLSVLRHIRAQLPQEEPAGASDVVSSMKDLRCPLMRPHAVKGIAADDAHA